MDKTLVKGLTVLEALARAGEPRGVSELAGELKLSKSNVHRLLNTLVAVGFAQVQDGRYGASLKLWELGADLMKRYDVGQFSRRAMERLAEKTGEDVRLTVLDRDRVEVIYVDKIDSSHPVRAHSEIGSRAPAYCGASGKLLLAYADAATIARASRKLKPHTKQTITDPDEFAAHLGKIRRLGYAINMSERTEQVRGIAAPVRDLHGTVVASISIAAPSERLSQKELQKLIPLICEAAAEASATTRPVNAPRLMSVGMPRAAAAKPRAVKSAPTKSPVRKLRSAV